MAGREVLIKSVLQAIPTYVMSCFKLPQTILEEVEKIIRRYWWGSKKARWIYWLAWNRLCRPKAEGGMGFRDMGSFNTALLAKQAWRIITHPDNLLSQVLKAKYFPRSPFLLAELGDRPSLTWRSILMARPFLETGLRRRIGNGADTPIWGVPWLVSEGFGKIITTRPMHSSFPNMVGDLIDWSRGEWSLELITQHMWKCDISGILQGPIGSPMSLDSTYWAYSKHGRFTVRSCYHKIMELAMANELSTSGAANSLSSPEWKWVWGLQLPPKIRTFVWRACNDILPVKVSLVRRQLGGILIALAAGST